MVSAVVAFAALPAAFAAIGSAVVVINNVTGKVKEQPTGVALRVGTDVVQDETVETAAASATRLIFSDNTQFEVGPSSQVVLDQFVFDPDPSKSKVALSIAKGAARFATGFLPKSDYEIRTPSATIGIRGTILDLDVATTGATGVYVEKGLAFVTGGGVTVQLHQGQSTYVPVHGVPSPAATGNPRPSQLQSMLQEASTTPEGAEQLAAAILKIYPFGGPGLTDLVATTLEQDPNLAPAFVKVGSRASTAQQISLGAGMGQAAVFFANNDQTDAKRLIVNAMAIAPIGMRTAFTDWGVNNTTTTTLVTTVTGVTSFGSSSCVSPSKPNGGC
jgi:hypothetical protein